MAKFAPKGNGGSHLVAAGLPVPQNPPLQSPSNFTLIGKPLPRKVSSAKLTGKAIFGTDMCLDGMLYAVIARPPVFGAKLEGFQAAAKLKGW